MHEFDLECSLDWDWQVSGVRQSTKHDARSLAMFLPSLFASLRIASVTTEVTDIVF